MVKGLRFTAVVVLILVLALALPYSGAFAMGDRREIDHRRDNRGDNGNYNGGERHYYRDGRWYKHDSTGNEIADDILAIGALVESLPPQHTTVVIQNTPYYYDNSHYYQRRPDNTYIVVEPPRR